MLVHGVAVLLASLVAACSGTPPGPAATTASSATPGPPTIAAISPSARPVLSPPTDPSTAPPTETPPAEEAGPPAARLAAEGGDPVTGQLGTYVWRDQGSDSPWLPGAPIAVGHGEPLTVRLAPPADIASWQARLVPASATGPAGTTPLGTGSGMPRFEAPRRGRWTLEVQVVFADGIGDARYFWRLDVR